ncbi:Skp family chaperone for outer membrane proteins [Novosphingobium chloroacetimidivorans]|uniref:Skp family chaperone for outer membrane proteins n=1 Tax=Novosphingobium chloroacetimidivorans TaxID=1428314 RepID=A0A7W7NVH9_9SPHN|nr:OmpH family outer membrane protein [Novosphingobium chloroacetimidivorans]MBB4858548.1 Skp family chaperone for outer membrane proteins [Novosphingobium chloroacetimidivorans]
MNHILKTAAAASLMFGAGVAQPALAQDSGTVVQGIAVANLDAVIANSNAFKTAETQRQTTYKAQIDQATSRGNALNAQLKPLADKFNADRQGGKANQASLEQQAATIQQLQESGQAELQRILQPVALSRAYVTEQVEDKLDQAVKSAMAKKKVSLLLNPQAIVAVNNNAYNLNQDVLNELNTLLPSAQIVPPAGWLPREARQQQAQQGQAATAAPAAAAPAATTGRKQTGR